MSASTSIALLRGINVTGRNKIPMKDLRDICLKLGWSDVQTYIQSGNVVFRAEGTREDLEAELEGAIEERFGLSIPVIVRSAQEWTAYIAGNPFPDESASEPARVALALSKAKPRAGVVEGLAPRAVAGERSVQVADAIWTHFPNGMGTSKLTPALIDRLVGSPVTGRNFRTVLKLQELASPQ